jgi:hypothetical protein
LVSQHLTCSGLVFLWFVPSNSMHSI